MLFPQAAQNATAILQFLGNCRPILTPHYALQRSSSIRKIGSQLAPDIAFLLTCATIVTMDAIKAMPLSCPYCAARMPETAAFCPGCGIAMKEHARASGRVGVLSERIAGALAYVTFIPAIIFLTMRPYRRNGFVRFHSVQSLLFCAAAVFAATLIRLAGFVVGLIPVAGTLIVVVSYVVGGIGVIALWAVLVAKALQGETFKLRFLGDFAEKYAALT